MTKRLLYTIAAVLALSLRACAVLAPSAELSPAMTPLWAKILYVHPSGAADAPGTSARPTTLAVAIQRLAGGGTILLKTDPAKITEYRCPLVLNGASNVNVYGVGTGYAIFYTVQLTNCRDVQLSRICAGPSPATVFGLTDCTNVKLMQCVGRGAGIGNRMVFGLDRCDGITFDGCYGSGTGRKIFQFYKSRNIVAARCFAQGGNFRGGFGNDQTPTMAYSVAYNTIVVDFVQCWGTWNEAAGKPAGAAYGIFGVDANQVGIYPEWPLEAKVTVRLCTAYTLTGQNVSGFIGAFFNTGLNDVAFSDCNAVVSHPVKPYSLGLKAYGGERCSASNLFVKGPLAGSASANWGLTVRATPNALPPVIPWPAAAMKVLGGPDLVAHAAALKTLLVQP